MHEPQWTLNFQNKSGAIRTAPPPPKEDYPYEYHEWLTGNMWARTTPILLDETPIAMRLDEGLMMSNENWYEREDHRDTV